MLLFRFAAALGMVRRGTQSLSMVRFAPNVALQQNRSLGKYGPPAVFGRVDRGGANSEKSAHYSSKATPLCATLLSA